MSNVIKMPQKEKRRKRILKSFFLNVKFTVYMIFGEIIFQIAKRTSFFKLRSFGLMLDSFKDRKASLRENIHSKEDRKET